MIYEECRGGDWPGRLNEAAVWIVVMKRHHRPAQTTTPLLRSSRSTPLQAERCDQLRTGERDGVARWRISALRQCMGWEGILQVRGIHVGRGIVDTMQELMRLYVCWPQMISCRWADADSTALAALALNELESVVIHDWLLTLLLPRDQLRCFVNFHLVVGS